MDSEIDLLLSRLEAGFSRADRLEGALAELKALARSLRQANRENVRRALVDPELDFAEAQRQLAERRALFAERVRGLARRSRSAAHRRALRDLAYLTTSAPLTEPLDLELLRATRSRVNV